MFTNNYQIEKKEEREREMRERKREGCYFQALDIRERETRWVGLG